jgi:hypothetical protein
MKKLVVAAVAALAAAAIATGVAAGSGGGGTLIAEDFACAILDGNGSTIAASSSQLWLYSNQQQTKVKLLCQGDGAPAPSLTYFNYANTGLTCNVPLAGSTTDWQDKVGRNGNSQLTCSVVFSGDADAAAIAAAVAGGAGVG